MAGRTRGQAMRNRPGHGDKPERRQAEGQPQAEAPGAAPSEPERGEATERELRLAALQVDLDRLRRLEQMLGQWSQESRGYAHETHDPCTWFAFVGLADNLEGQRRALQEILRACATEQSPLKRR